MGAFINLPLVDAPGVAELVQIYQIAYIQEDTDDAARCFVGVETSGAFSRFHVDQTAGQTAFDVHAASGTVVSGYPVAPMVQYVRENGFAIYFRGTTVANVSASGPALCSVNTIGTETPWPILANAFQVATDLELANGSSGAGAVNRVLLQAFVEPKGTFGAPITTDYNVGLTLVSHTVDSGVYLFDQTGPDAQTSYTVFASANDERLVMTTRPFAPGSTQFFVVWARASTVFAGARTDVGGALTDPFNLSCIRPAPGVYNYTITQPPQGGKFAAVFSPNGPTPLTNGWAIEYTGPDTFTVHCTDFSIPAPGDQAHSIAVYGLDDGGSAGYQAFDPYFELVVLKANPVS